LGFFWVFLVWINATFNFRESSGGLILKIKVSILAWFAPLEYCIFPNTVHARMRVIFE